MGQIVSGIFAGSGVGIDSGAGIIAGKPDMPSAIEEALAALLPPAGPFLLRGYLHYAGQPEPRNVTPNAMGLYVTDRIALDLAVCYRAHNDPQGFCDFVRSMVRRYGEALASIQIGEEPNNPHAATGGDGSFAGIHQALILGVKAAKDEAKRLGLPIGVGINAVISFDHNDLFWPTLAAQGDATFYDSLDYVGIDFYPGVFAPLPPGLDHASATKAVLGHFRNTNLVAGKVPPSLPMRITEIGWPTSPERSPELQAEVVAAILEGVFEISEELNITHRAFFGLRDADSSEQGLRFGLLYDDYRPKPAFAVYASWIRQHAPSLWSQHRGRAAATPKRKSRAYGEKGSASQL